MKPTEDMSKDSIESLWFNYCSLNEKIEQLEVTIATLADENRLLLAELDGLKGRGARKENKIDALFGIQPPAYCLAARAEITQKRNKLTHQQRLDIHTAFQLHKRKWDALAILIDLVEEAHGIK